MKGTGIVSLMLLLSVAIFAYAEASTFTSHGAEGRSARQSSSFFGRPLTCGWNRHWSPQYGRCIATRTISAN